MVNKNQKSNISFTGLLDLKLYRCSIYGPRFLHSAFYIKNELGKIGEQNAPEALFRKAEGREMDTEPFVAVEATVLSWYKQEHKAKHRTKYRFPRHFPHPCPPLANQLLWV